MPALICIGYLKPVSHLNKADLNSLDFVVNKFFMKLFATGNINIFRKCQQMFNFALPSEQLDRRRSKFVDDYGKFVSNCSLIDVL